MNRQLTFQEFITKTSPEVTLWPFVGYLGATALLCYALSLLYARRGRALSNRESFGQNFVVLGMTTMLIISVVKASLALSLGLVGALSIVRFRTAIKEPEELGYLFLTIAIGLGFGADQWLITTVAFVLIAGTIWLRGSPSEVQAKQKHSSLFLTVSSEGGDKISLPDISSALRGRCAGLSLKRFNETDNAVEASYLVKFDDYQQLEQARAALRNQGDSVKITFVDSEGAI